MGIEVKSSAYLGRVIEYSKLPKEMTEFTNKIAPTLKAYEYRNFMSTENRINKEHISYMIDFCARCGSPPSEITFKMYKNLPDILWFGAEGKCIDPEVEYNYAAELILESSWANCNWLAVQFPKKFRDNINLRNLCVIEGTCYIIPQFVETPNIGSVVALGNSEEEVMEKCIEVAKEVKGNQIEFSIADLKEAQNRWNKLDSFGVEV